MHANATSSFSFSHPVFGLSAVDREHYANLCCQPHGPALSLPAAHLALPSDFTVIPHKHPPSLITHLQPTQPCHRGTLSASHPPTLLHHLPTCSPGRSITAAGGLNRSQRHRATCRSLPSWESCCRDCSSAIWLLPCRAGVSFTHIDYGPNASALVILSRTLRSVPGDHGSVNPGMGDGEKA